MLASALAVLVGGALGTAARALLGAAVPDGWMVVAINAVGSLLLGAAAAATADAPAWVRHGLCAGVLGGFTSMSAVAVAVAASTADAALAPAAAGIGLALAHLAASLLGAWAGLALGRRGRRERLP